MPFTAQQKSVLLAATALCLGAGTPAWAQASEPPQASDASAGNEIVVTGVLETSEKDVLAGTSIVKGEELTRDLRPSIGETLAKQPGVSATSFGPSASRPLLRGFQGERVRAELRSPAEPIVELDDILRDALSDLLSADTLYGPVVDADGRVAGVLSMEVLSHALSQRAEHIPTASELAEHELAAEEAKAS